MYSTRLLNESGNQLICAVRPGSLFEVYGFLISKDHLEDKQSEIKLLGVSHKHRQKYIGVEMMKQFQLDALSRGVTSVFVWSDHVAVNFYKKFQY